MNLGEWYYQTKKRKDPSRLLNDLHNKVIAQLNQNAINNDIKSLEECLNTIFYPKKKKDYIEKHNKIRDLVISSFQEINQVTVDNFDFGNIKYTYDQETDDPLKIIKRELWDVVKHSRLINKDTLIKRKEKLESALSNIDNFKNKERREEIERLANTLINDINKVLQNYTTNDKGNFLFSKNKGLAEDIEKIDKVYDTLTRLAGDFTPRQYGDILETALNAISQSFMKKQTDDVVKQGIKDIFKSKGQGQKTKSEKDRKSFLNLNIDAYIDGLNEDIQKTIKKDEKLGKRVIKYENISFSIDEQLDPYSNRQVKMDVLLHFDKKDFRVTAKNWSSFSSDKDFGSTPLLYALLRSLDDETTEQYVYALADETSINKIQWHYLARYSALIDTLMGYSQKEDYTDTIIMNNRQEKKIYVYSIYNIVDKIKDNIKKLNINNYDDSEIENTLKKIQDSIQAVDHRSQLFEGLSYLYLKSMKIALSMSAVLVLLDK